MQAADVLPEPTERNYLAGADLSVCTDDGNNHMESRNRFAKKYVLGIVGHLGISFYVRGVVKLT